MGSYYEEILDEIRELMKNGKNSEAMAMVERELNMPYVPSDAEKQLRSLKRDLQYALSEKGGDTEESLSSLLNKLKSRPQVQLAAAARLSSRNLRECIEAIQDWLSRDPQPEAAAMMIEAIAEQEIGEEFVFVRNGVEYTFWGDAVTPCARSEGFLCALKYLQKWLASSHPDFFRMCKAMLTHEVYMFLPLSYEEDEGKDLALNILQQVSSMMDDGALYREICASEGAEIPQNTQLC